MAATRKGHDKRPGFAPLAGRRIYHPGIAKIRLSLALGIHFSSNETTHDKIIKIPRFLRFLLADSY